MITEQEVKAKLTGRTIIVTGGAGMIGSFIVDRLLAYPVHRIIVIDNLRKGFRENVNQDKRVQLKEVDIGYDDQIERLFVGVHYMFHQSAYRINRCVEEPEDAVVSMGKGAVQLWNAASKFGVQKIVFASSASVYGQAEQFPTRVDHHLNNCDSIYGGLKFLTECIARSMSIEFVGLRYSNVYGPRMDGNGKYSEVFIKWYEAIKAGKKPIVNGDGTLDLLYCEDVAWANIVAMCSDVCGVYNVAPGRETPLGELCDLIGQAMVKAGYKYEGYDIQKTDNRSFHRWNDPGAFKYYWQPSTPLSVGIERFVKYMERKK